MYKVVIFDFFGVLCAPVATNWFRKTVPGREALLPAFQALCTQSDLGVLPRTEFNKQLAALTGVPLADVVRGIAAEIVINQSLVTYVQDLRGRGYRIACLSNGHRDWTQRVMDDHQLAGLFDTIVLSGDLGIVKPDPAIYHHTLEVLQIPATQAIFVDDRKENVDAGEACGIRSLVFTDTPAFIAELEPLIMEGTT